MQAFHRQMCLSADPPPLARRLGCHGHQLNAYSILCREHVQLMWFHTMVLVFLTTYHFVNTYENNPVNSNNDPSIIRSLLLDVILTLIAAVCSLRMCAGSVHGSRLWVSQIHTTLLSPPLARNLPLGDHCRPHTSREWLSRELT